MLSATTGMVASITGRDRSESNVVSPCQSTVPPLARSPSAGQALPVLADHRRTKFGRACRGAAEPLRSRPAGRRAPAHRPCVAGLCEHAAVPRRGVGLGWGGIGVSEDAADAAASVLE